jgi:hypothetical protein
MKVGKAGSVAVNSLRDSGISDSVSGHDSGASDHEPLAPVVATA